MRLVTPGLAQAPPLRPSLAITQNVHRERLVQRQVCSVDHLRILDPISPYKDRIHDPFSPQSAEAAGAEVPVALSAFDWMF